VFVSRLKDDGYYYQGNYATDIYIKVVTDDSYIAKAEARYNSEKNKLNQKEQMLDMKMKNLDTEISALTTEYDTIKSTISKNIEKTFKRYSA
jgi:predicted  nucleic acid-binding Zn-ribbon protein